MSDRLYTEAEIRERLLSKEAAKAAVKVIDPDWPSFVSPMSRADFDALRNAGDALTAAANYAFDPIHDTQPDQPSTSGSAPSSVTARLERAHAVEEALREKTELYDSLGDPIENFDYIVAVALGAVDALADQPSENTEAEEGRNG